MGCSTKAAQEKGMNYRLWGNEEKPASTWNQQIKERVLRGKNNERRTVVTLMRFLDTRSYGTHGWKILEYGFYFTF